MADIFISYARADKPRVAPLVAALEAQGWSVWWDPAIAPGQEFDELIADELKKARAVLVVWTPASVASRWVRGEARTGADRGVLVPVRLENAELPIDARVLHTTDIDDWNGDAGSEPFRALVGALAALLGTAGGGAAPAATFAAPKVPSGHPSLAVLPFVNLSGDPEQEYFADGMTEEIVTALSRVRSIFVIASGSTRGYKGRAASPQSVGRALGVGYVLEGSVRKSGDRVRIGVRLMDARDDRQIWAERYEDTLQDVFALQDRVALSVVGALEPTLQTAEIRRAVVRPARDPDSYDLYLRAIALLDSYDKADMREAIGLLETSIARDPQCAVAMSVAAYAYAQLVVSGWSEEPERDRGRALDWARKAVRLAGDDAEALAWVTGAYLPLEQDPAGTIALIDRSLALNPGSSMAWMMSGWLRAAAGESETALEHFARSMQLDPASPDRGHQLAGIALAKFDQGRDDEAIRILREAVHIQPAISLYHALLAASYGHRGDAPGARAAFADYARLSDRPIESRTTLFRNPAHRQRFLEGIARARALGPAAGQP